MALVRLSVPDGNIPATLDAIYKTWPDLYEGRQDGTYPTDTEVAEEAVVRLLRQTILQQAEADAVAAAAQVQATADADIAAERAQILTTAQQVADSIVAAA